jgi:dihydroneopterin aldolase
MSNSWSKTMNEAVRLDGLVPDRLKPRTRKILLQDYCVDADIGFHDFEVGAPQRLSVTVEAWIEPDAFPRSDQAEEAWDYDFLRRDIAGLVSARRYNLQETLARAIYELVAARRGVAALRVSTRKPDIYPDCAGVGVELASF